jgi:nucleotide-binding universal stress UspA family protein
MSQSLGVLVGVQDLRQGRRVLDWAADQAAATGRMLTVCHVLPAGPAGGPVPLALQTAQAERARVLVCLAADRAKEVDPQLAVERRVERGPAAAVLLSYAGGADELVLGPGAAHGAHGLGATAAQLAAHALCPVTVVRGGRPGGRGVVVGIDGSDRDQSTLDYAVTYALAHNLPVHAVHAYRATAAAAVDPPTGPPAGSARHTAMDLVLAAVQPWTVKFPDVAITTAISAGHPAGVLLDACAGADLLVVGSRGHGRLAGRLLGSVSQLLLRRGSCAITVTR